MRVYDPIDMRISPDLSNEERAYEIFKRCWINQHIDDITMTQTEALYENDESNKNLHEYEDSTDGMSFDEYVEEYGFANGEIYPCYEEFLNNDFEDFLYYPEIEKIIDNTDEESGISKIICYRYRLSQVLGRKCIDFPSVFSDNKLLIETLKKLKVDKISFGNYDNTVVDEHQENSNKPIYYDEYEDKIIIDEKSFSEPTILRDDYLQIKTTGHDYDFVASVQNKTDRPIHLIFDEEVGVDVDELEIDSLNWFGILANDNGYRMLEALVNNKFSKE